MHISDVVATVLACLDKPPAQQTFDVVGPKPITFIDWLQAIRRAQGKPAAKTIGSPFSLILFIAHFGRFVFPMLSPDNLRMLQRGNTADVKPLEQYFGRLPLAPVEGLRLS